MSIQSIVKGLSARRVGDSWMAQCPAHHDRSPSLSISEKEGTILFHCHAGCTQQAVLEALKALGFWEKKVVPQIVRIYDYTDEKGKLLYQVVRYEPKSFKQRRPDGQQGWIWRKFDNPFLYRLPEVLTSKRVFVVEGEKDADTLHSKGFVATTNVGGANAAWLPQYTEALRNKDVVLIPDNDRPGRSRVHKIARALFGKVSELVIIEIESDAKDVSDWFDQGHSTMEFLALVDGHGL